MGRRSWRTVGASQLLCGEGDFQFQSFWRIAGCAVAGLVAEGGCRGVGAGGGLDRQADDEVAGVDVEGLGEVAGAYGVGLACGVLGRGGLEVGCGVQREDREDRGDLEVGLRLVGVDVVALADLEAEFQHGGLVGLHDLLLGDVRDLLALGGGTLAVYRSC